MNAIKPQFRTLAIAAIGGLLSVSAFAADREGQLNASAKYQQEVAFCKSGQSQQDYKTCMQEAGAALVENRRGNLSTAPAQQLAVNTEDRCGVQTGDDRVACQARMEGLGRTEGSVEGGGIIREITIVKVGE